jgi:hypothetical protein
MRTTASGALDHAVGPASGGNAYALEVVKTTLVVVWVGEPTVANLTDVYAHLLALRARDFGDIALFTVITASTGMPEPDARALLKRQFEEMRGGLKASAIVLEKQGVEGTLSRAILSTLLIVSRRPFPMKIFGARPEAGRWLAQYQSTHTAELVVARADALAAGLGATRPRATP